MTIPNSVYDAALAKIATGDRVNFCSAEPADYAGIAAVRLDSAPLTPGAGNGDWTIADGDESGRKLTLEEQTGLDPDSAGTVTWLAIDDGSELLATNPLDSQAVTPGQTWKNPATKILEIPDPTYE
jgi:hypothetical protein